MGTSMKAAFLMIVMLTGAHAAAAQEIRPTLDKLKETGVVHLGYRETSRPFSFKNEGQPAGYSVDLCLKIVDALRQSLKLPSLKTQWEAVTPGDRIPKLVKGTIDLECGSTTITFGRMEQVAFSHMIYVDGASVLTTVDSGIATVKDMAGKRIGVIPSTTTEKVLTSALTTASVKANIVPLTEHGDGLRGLEEGRLDAYASDRILLAGLLSTARSPAKLKLSPELFSHEPYALMLRRGDNSFQASVNRALSHLYRSGGLVQIYERWFGPFANATPLVRALYLLHSWPD
jgi:glutamate/aspartate transport system substrate-binding protein